MYRLDHLCEFNGRNVYFVLVTTEKDLHEAEACIGFQSVGFSKWDPPDRISSQLHVSEDSALCLICIDEDTQLTEDEMGRMLETSFAGLFKDMVKAFGKTDIHELAFAGMAAEHVRKVFANEIGQDDEYSATTH